MLNIQFSDAFQAKLWLNQRWKHWRLPFVDSADRWSNRNQVKNWRSPNASEERYRPMSTVMQIQFSVKFSQVDEINSSVFMNHHSEHTFPRAKWPLFSLAMLSNLSKKNGITSFLSSTTFLALAASSVSKWAATISTTFQAIDHLRCQQILRNLLFRLEIQCK